MASQKRDPAAAVLVKLPRGGYVVHTAAGGIQAGVPPETVKDHLQMKTSIPALFVVGRHMFDRHSGVSVAELEFPIYFNFFVKRRQATIITFPDVEARIREVLQETVFGPDQPDYELDYDSTVPAEARTLGLEYRALRKHLKEAYTLDNIVRFVHLGSSCRLVLPRSLYTPSDQQTASKAANPNAESDALSADAPVLPEVVISSQKGEWQFYEDGELIARVPHDIRAIIPRFERHVRASFAYAFEPPMFGITVLGSSHGFDPNASNTGFVLWMNGRGIMVDPPLNSGEILHAQGIPSVLIDTVIVTHCHADHDGGTFQKILEHKQIDLITTTTIFNSFIRKYSAISGLGPGFLRRLFCFRPAIVGQPQRIHGGELHYFYSLHTLPTIGFIAYFSGKSFYYSSDMCYLPSLIEEMVTSGAMNRQRARFFLENSWNYNLIMHEAGVPPVHTPISVLSALPARVKARLRVVHCAEKDVPEDSGLRLAKPGIEHTIRIPVTPPEFGHAIRALSLFENVDFFRNLSLPRARELLQVCQPETFPPGEYIIRKGTEGDKFYIIDRGSVEVVMGQDQDPGDTSEADSPRYGTMRRHRLTASDWFGETALITDGLRTASVRAITQVDVFSFRKHEFLSLLRDTDIVSQLVNLAEIRGTHSWRLIQSNRLLNEMLAASQAMDFFGRLTAVHVKRNTCLWKAHSRADYAFLIDEGSVKLDLPVGVGDSANNLSFMELFLQSAVVLPETGRGPAAEGEATPDVDAGAVQHAGVGAIPIAREGQSESAPVIGASNDGASGVLGRAPIPSDPHIRAGSALAQYAGPVKPLRPPADVLAARQPSPLRERSQSVMRGFRFTRGAFMCETNALLSAGTHMSTCTAVNDCKLLRIERAHMHAFLTANPGMKVALIDQYFAE